jgi:hypothetical protein
MVRGDKVKSQVKGNGVSPGIAAPSALRGNPPKKWDVSKEAKRVAEENMDKSEPFIQQPIVGDGKFWPAIYGAPLQERKREQILRDVTSGALSKQLGNRQVMLDDDTIKWLMAESDRIALIESDLLFERYAKEQGLFKSPSDLAYARKIYPGYFERRDKMAEWLSATQMKIYQVRSRGVQSEDEFRFSLLIAALPAHSQRMINTPVHELMNLSSETFDDGLYQKGAVRQVLLPTWDKSSSSERQQVPFAGIGARGFDKDWFFNDSDRAGEGISGALHGIDFSGGRTLGAFTGRRQGGGPRGFDGLTSLFA